MAAVAAVAAVLFALLAVAVGVGVTSFKKSVTPYITFAEARRSSGLVQVNGVLADKQYSGRDRFLMSDLVPGTPKDSDEVLIARQALHAFRLRFQHPRTKDWIEVEAPLAADIRRALAALRTHRPKR